MKAIVVLASCALLSACGGKSDDAQRQAAGQVLEGTISDAMLPLDTVMSEPPRAKITGTPGPGAEATGQPEGDETPAAEDAEAPAPSAAAPAADED